MSYRAKKYGDIFNPLVRRSVPPTSYDFPFARKAMTTNIETVRLLLKSELARNPLFRGVWKAACILFEQDKEFFRNQSKIPVPDECHIAIIAYTLENTLSNDSTLQIYVDFNKKCRELSSEASWIRFPFKSFYCLLAHAIPGVQSVPDNNEPPYYRGVSLHYNPEFIEENILMDFSQFTSFSASRKEALNFIMMNGGKGTLLILSHPPMAGIGIKHYSEYAHEEEVLVCPWSTFTIRWSKRESNIHEIVLSSEGSYFDSLPYTINKSAPTSSLQV